VNRPQEHRALIVVAKRPEPGRAKTRLCPPLDAATAAGLYACFLRDILDLVRRVEGVRRIVAYTPDDAEDYFRALAPDMELAPQRGADLGERLDDLVAAALASGAERVAVISSDSPTLPAAYLRDAFALLDCHDLVLGPSDDGGYYLVGLTRPQPRLFREVTMSTPAVLRDTLAVAGELALRTALLPPWYDVDTAAELQRLRAELQVAGAGTAPHTRRFLEGLMTRRPA
jgi:rSAM/selenodomain-associated transferase 1